MKLSTHFLSPQIPLHHSIFTKSLNTNRLELTVSHANSSESNTGSQLALSLQSETLTTLEWTSLCKQLSPFTSTSMGVSATENAEIVIGESLEESRILLGQTSAALAFMEVMESQPLDLSGIEDVSKIVGCAVAGELLSVRELCALRRTLMAARDAWETLKGVVSSAGDRRKMYSPLLEILQNCNFEMELERKIGFCIDCSLSTILDRASEDLEIIRVERKTNMENLTTLLKKVASQIFQTGGIDRPLVTNRRSRMCVGIRSSRKYLLRDGIILDSSSSGATYFMEPKEAVELNNMEVRLASSEKAEELAILSLLTSEVAESAKDIEFLLNKVLEMDLAFARAVYAQWLDGACPIFDLDVNIEGIRHPLLVGSTKTPSDSQLEEEIEVFTGKFSTGASNFPVPIDIKVESGTKVVVISGPNTGGKTASMKTLGLASVMSKAGMFLPARNHPRLPWFDLVLADIGDHQSLEQNLSTFSGHLSRICKIFAVTSERSLVLLDEICSGTDPSEGVALSTSILHFLKDRVKLGVVTTHYADLSLLKDQDTRFGNAAMEFSLETLQPTFRVLWGSAGDSNALSIANSIGFNVEIIKRAQEWVEKLKPEQQQQREGLLYQSLTEEKMRLKAQARAASSLHAEIMEIYHEIHEEADNVDHREKALKEKETRTIEQELNTAKLQIEKVVQKFEYQLESARADQFNLLTKKAESEIGSIIESHRPRQTSFGRELDKSYTPRVGEQVYVQRLGDKLATVIGVQGDDETVLVQYGKIRVFVKKNNIRPVSIAKEITPIDSVLRLRRQKKSREFPNLTEVNKDGDITLGPVVQTSKNTVDLRGMRVEEAANYLNMAISGRESSSVLFIIHGMGTGVVKERVLNTLKNHPRISKYEQESPMNYGCTVAYIK